MIPVILVDGLSTERSKPGDVFTATLANELIAGEFVIAERGARVEGQVVASTPAGSRNGVAILTVMLTRLHLSDGQTVPIRTDGFERRAELVRDRPARDLPAILPADLRIPFRLGVAVSLTEHAALSR